MDWPGHYRRVFEQEIVEEGRKDLLGKESLSRYRASYVEEITGIPEHTLRKWPGLR